MQANWYFDFISPFSYLQLPRVLQWRDRIAIAPVPIVLGAILRHLGTLGPAEIPGRREFTYRFVLWQAEQAGVPLRFPPEHPFNPLAALRLCLAAGSTWESVEAIFDRIWREGRAAAKPGELGGVAAMLGIDDVEAALTSPTIKQQLADNTNAAIAAGVFGVPTLQVGAELFWGNDASPMIEDRLAHPGRFDTDEFRRTSGLPIGVVRRR